MRKVQRIDLLAHILVHSVTEKMQPAAWLRPLDDEAILATLASLYKSSEQLNQFSAQVKQTTSYSLRQLPSQIGQLTITEANAYQIL
ncbi:hypothetical protein XI09_10680 [Bradyrhizobium sp. CCBAU 11386]|uniref:hypothetical protein n=1 Tax=Bradyrhizobium sp. CCBAU 11386 TaxID=1630837 RepID=UPI0023020C49|nr:hypothetical protein [Bradyrhizobium sp. CCBAU 11386]MDA9505145.1 hypothetical protein [Bradyrhizobium sp. CCBAU 11386]